MARRANQGGEMVPGSSLIEIECAPVRADRHDPETAISAMAAVHSAHHRMARTPAAQNRDHRQTGHHLTTASGRRKKPDLDLTTEKGKAESPLRFVTCHRPFLK
jgi:hypothetical protein